MSHKNINVCISTVLLMNTFFLAASAGKDEGKTDFNTSLLSRLKSVEAEASEYKKKLAQQITLNEKLHGEIGGLKEDLDRISHSSRGESVNETLMHELKIERTQNSRLQLKICEMEKFLADYGLVWVGSNREREQGLLSSQYKVLILITITIVCIILFIVQR